MIVRSTIDLADNLGLTVVAEGVETAAIQGTACVRWRDEGAGYHIAAPAGGRISGVAWSQARRGWRQRISVLGLGSPGRNTPNVFILSRPPRAPLVHPASDVGGPSSSAPAPVGPCCAAADLTGPARTLPAAAAPLPRVRAPSAVIAPSGLRLPPGQLPQRAATPGAGQCLPWRRRPWGWARPGRWPPALEQAHGRAGLARALRGRRLVEQGWVKVTAWAHGPGRSRGRPHAVDKIAQGFQEQSASPSC